MAKLARPSKNVIAALVDAGIITDPNMVMRVLIDIRGDSAPMVYVQRLTSNQELLSVVQALTAEFDPSQLVDQTPPSIPIVSD